MVELLRMEVGCDLAAPSAVRRSISRLSGLGSVLGDALLVASELVTRAVLDWGYELEDERLEVVVSRHEDAVVIVVVGPRFAGQETKVRTVPDGDGGGLGMVIVDLLARRWGTARRGGYRVWAELGLPESPS